jgi:hypothetical protein
MLSYKGVPQYFKRIDNLQRIALNKAKNDAEKETAIAKYDAMKERFVALPVLVAVFGASY